MIGRVKGGNKGYHSIQRDSRTTHMLPTRSQSNIHTQVQHCTLSREVGSEIQVHDRIIESGIICYHSNRRSARITPILLTKLPDQYSDSSGKNTYFIYKSIVCRRLTHDSW